MDSRDLRKIAEAYTLTRADKVGNTKAWQDRDKKNVKTGEPLYTKADHLNKEGYQRDPDQQEKERKTSKQTDPSKAGFTGIGNSIEDIMRQNAAMKKAAAKKTKKEELEATGIFTAEEIEAIVESEAVAQGAQKRAEQLASKRRQKGYREKGYNAYRPGKNERAGYNLSRAARSSDASPETQRTKKKQPAGTDTSQIGHYKKRDEKVTVGKRGKPLKQPKYKLSMGQRVDHHSNKAWERRDPKKNPKHEANK
tara:strand:- start:40 stop:795 length:756 start_codon:yes stop_codon:yes gene_type:complete